jgi:TM2 domain-containing membrane protein YozV
MAQLGMASENQNELIWSPELKAFVLPGMKTDEKFEGEFVWPEFEDGAEESDANPHTFVVHAYGLQNRPYNFSELLRFADQRMIKPSTILQQTGSDLMLAASNIPGVFSQKKYVTALLLSWFFGVLGVDRFYLGHTRLGILKLITIGGVGIWALIDFILIATRSVRDGYGRPLA